MNWSKYRAQIVLLMDILLIFACNFALFLPALFRHDILLLNLVLHIGLLTVCVYIFQFLFRTYESLWRYAESREYFVLLAGMSLGFLLYSAVNLLLDTNLIWITQALTGTVLALLLMLAVRFLYRMYRSDVMSRSTEGRSYAAIIGTGTARLLTDFADKRAALDCIMAHYTPGQSWTYPDAMLAQTAAWCIEIQTICCKANA